MTDKEIKKILNDRINTFNKCKTDKDKYQFLIDYKGTFTVMLDNDETFLTISDKISHSLTDDEMDILNDSINNFDSYFGDSDGVVSLLTFIGIECSPVNLKPCPFCGNKEGPKLQIVVSSLYGPGYSHVRCTNCQARTLSSSLPRHPTDKIQNRKEAEKLHDEDSVRIWNTRPKNT